MAKVIEFYIPKNFRKPVVTVVQPQLGKIIELCPVQQSSKECLNEMTVFLCE